MTDTQVLVVGAGPTGLMLASELALHGVACRVVEQRAEEANLTRAFGVHARTLEQLDMRGLAETLVPQGIQVGEIRPTFGRLSVRLPMRHPESRFPFVLIVPQARTEAMLTERVRAQGVEIVRGGKVVDVREVSDGVVATIEGPDGTRSERADYVVGCDGAHSQVRQCIGVGFTGATYATHLLLADLRLADPDVTAVRTYLGRDGMVLMPPFGDGWVRAVIWDRRQQDVPLDEPLGIDEVVASLNRLAGRDLGVREMRWSTRFRSERRQADAYRTGRVFLAGDAAHVHSPLGALGMNTGIQDAMNLGWKLAAAVHGHRADWLLDSYHSERHPIGTDALRITDLLQRISVAPAPIRVVRPFLARGALALPPIGNAMRRRVAGLSIAYPPQDSGHAHPWEGRRVPDARLSTGRLYEALRGGRFVLVWRGDIEPLETGDWADRVDVALLADDTTFPAVTLVRPDGYAAWAGEKDHVRAALSHWCGPARESRVAEGRSSEETVQALYGAFGAGDLDAIDVMLADDVQWTYIGGGPRPSRRVWHGKLEVRAFFTDIFQQADMQDFSVHRIMPGATTVVVQGSETARLKPDGSTVTSDWIQVFDVQDGVITHMTEYSIPVPAPATDR